MKVLIGLLVIFAVICAAHSYVYQVYLDTGRCHPFYLRGKTTVELYGNSTKKEIIFEKELISSYGSLQRRNVDFSEEDIQKVVVTWNTENKYDIAVLRAVIYNELKKQQPIFVTETGSAVTLKNGESVTLNLKK